MIIPLHRPVSAHIWNAPKYRCDKTYPSEFSVLLPVALQFLPLASLGHSYKVVDYTKGFLQTCAVVDSGRVPWVWDLSARCWKVTIGCSRQLIQQKKTSRRSETGEIEKDKPEMLHSAHSETRRLSAYQAMSSQYAYSSRMFLPPCADSQTTSSTQ